MNRVYNAFVALAPKPAAQITWTETEGSVRGVVAMIEQSPFVSPTPPKTTCRVRQANQQVCSPCAARSFTPEADDVRAARPSSRGRRHTVHRPGFAETAAPKRPRIEQALPLMPADAGGGPGWVVGTWSGRLYRACYSCLRGTSCVNAPWSS
jgi:hypothetical protein